MQVACQVCSGITLNRPLIDGVNLNALPLHAAGVEGLLLQMFVFLQHLQGFLILLLGASNQVPEFHQLALTVVAQDVQIGQKGLHHTPIGDFLPGVNGELLTKMLLSLSHLIAIGLSFPQMPAQFSQSAEFLLVPASVFLNEGIPLSGHADPALQFAPSLRPLDPSSTTPWLPAGENPASWA